MKDLLIFGGTTEGRELAETLSDKGQRVILSVATQYGKEMIPQQSQYLQIKVGRLDHIEMSRIITANGIGIVIDATHPYAVEVSKHIKQACGTTMTEYLRLLRDTSGYDEDMTMADTIEESCTMVEDGNVLATTGSKQIGEYTQLVDYKQRLYARVLPTQESIDLCKKAGLDDDHIITSFGVLSVAENMEMMARYQIKTMITKDGGTKGGFGEKRLACKQGNIKCIVVKRPMVEDGFSMTEILEKIGVENK